MESTPLQHGQPQGETNPVAERTEPNRPSQAQQTEPGATQTVPVVAAGGSEAVNSEPVNDLPTLEDLAKLGTELDGIDARLAELDNK